MRAVLWLISLSLVPSMALETFQFYQARLCQEDTQMCYAMKILVHQTCANSDTLSVYLIHLYLNVTLPQVFFKHFASKNQRPSFHIKGTLVENRSKKRSSCPCYLTIYNPVCVKFAMT